MLRDFSTFLWLLKVGALPNLYFLGELVRGPLCAVDPQLLVPARILWAVSAFRCLFPNQYKDNVVFHDTPLSSIFLTRLLATFAEIGFIYLLARVLRLLNVERVGWVDARLLVHRSAGDRLAVLRLGRDRHGTVRALLLGGARLGGAHRGERRRERRALAGARRAGRRRHSPHPQPALRRRLPGLAGPQSEAPARGREARAPDPLAVRVAGPPLREGLRRSLHERHATTDATAWGGLVVLLWMAGYFATLLPLWAHTIVAVFSR